jgi:acyl dehydratase
MSETLGDRVVRELQTRGWGRGVQENKFGEVCVGGALSYAAVGKNYTPWLSEEWTKLWQAMADIVHEEHQLISPVVFNDRVAGSVEDVILLVKKAQARLDEE